MQVMQSSLDVPRRLSCSGCRHWERTAASGRVDMDEAGRCGRFGEARPASARPRCNICWEPAAPGSSAQDTALADG
ncbi:MAG TPA: hypothetical protein VIC60_11200 [Thermomicrobiales bacterium]|jgi:hypothetical protein